jgi:hypothetical protein
MSQDIADARTYASWVRASVIPEWGRVARCAVVSSARSVDRAISILQVLARHGTTSVTEIAAEPGLRKSTVVRLPATLDARAGRAER